jgi:hypothetical protein
MENFAELMLCRAIGPSKSLAAKHRLKEEIQRLSEQQGAALKTAMFIGMTTDEAKEFDKRGGRLTKLVKELAMVSKAR